MTSVDGNITDRPDIVLETLGKCEGNGTNPAIEEVEQQITTLSDWLSATAALDDISNRFQRGRTKVPKCRHWQVPLELRFMIAPVNSSNAGWRGICKSNLQTRAG